MCVRACAGMCVHVCVWACVHVCAYVCVCDVGVQNKYFERQDEPLMTPPINCHFVHL